MAALWFWLLSFIFLVGLLCTIGFQLMCLVDLELDYINPYDSASRINMVIVPEFVAQGVLCFFYLLTGDWFMFLFALPYMCYNVRLYMQRKHLVDVTEIYNQLRWEKKQRFFKIAYLLLLFFLSLFWYFDNIAVILLFVIAVDTFRATLVKLCVPFHVKPLLGCFGVLQMNMMNNQELVLLTSLRCK